VASTAAGPAFEGWHISCGMRAVKGAVESAEEVGGKIKLKVIGDTPPEGIAGSGLIDIISILVQEGRINKAGVLKNKRFIISNKPKRIVLTQKDVREVQLAKAALSVGIKFLRQRCRHSVDKFYLTGSFGTYLNKDNARRIGLIPSDIEPGRIEFLNRGALSGAEMVLLNPNLEKKIGKILKNTEHISLTENRKFQSEFASAMYF